MKKAVWVANKYLFNNSCDSKKKKKKMFDLVNFDQILANELDNNEVNILS